MVARTNCIRRRNIIVRKQLKRKRVGISFQILQILSTYPCDSVDERIRNLMRSLVYMFY